MRFDGVSERRNGVTASQVAKIVVFVAVVFALFGWLGGIVRERVGARDLYREHVETHHSGPTAEVLNEEVVRAIRESRDDLVEEIQSLETAIDGLRSRIRRLEARLARDTADGGGGW